MHLELRRRIVNGDYEEAKKEIERGFQWSEGERFPWTALMNECQSSHLPIHDTFFIETLQ